MWLARLLCPFYFLAQLRGRRRKLFFRRWRPDFKDLPDGLRIWIHTLSVGELRAAAVLARGLLERYPERRPVLTVATVSGYETARRCFGEEFPVYPGPLHCPRTLRRYVSAIRPELFILVESDLWPDLLALLRREGIPAVFVNAALSRRSFARLKHLPFLARWLYGSFEVIGAASREDALRLSTLSAGPRVVYLGNLKYDFPPPGEEEIRRLRRELEGILEDPVIVCGSTHPGEESLLLSAFRILGRGTLVLCPRHPERAGEVLGEVRRLGFRGALRSRPERAGVLVVDTLGELAALYALARVAFVGGTLVPVGGHNLLEPAAVGVPVVFGPYVESVASVAEELESSGGGIRVRKHPEEIARAFGRALSEAETRGEAARRVWRGHRGALERYLALLDKYLTRT